MSELPSDIKETLVKEASVSALDAALAGAVKTRLTAVLTYLNEELALIQQVRMNNDQDNENLILTSIFKEGLEKLLK